MIPHLTPIEAGPGIMGADPHCATLRRVRIVLPAGETRMRHLSVLSMPVLLTVALAQSPVVGGSAKGQASLRRSSTFARLGGRQGA